MLYEQTVENKRVLKSDGLLFIVVLAGFFALLLLMNLLASVSVLWGSIGKFLYMGLAVAFIYWFMKKRIIMFRYVLAEDRLLAYRKTGNKEKLMECVLLEQLRGIAPYAALAGIGRENFLGVGKKQQAMGVLHGPLGGQKQLLLINADARLLQLLKEKMESQQEG